MKTILRVENRNLSEHKILRAPHPYPFVDQETKTTVFYLYFRGRNSTPSMDKKHHLDMTTTGLIDQVLITTKSSCTILILSVPKSSLCLSGTSGDQKYLIPKCNYRKYFYYNPLTRPLSCNHPESSDGRNQGNTPT